MRLLPLVALLVPIVTGCTAPAADEPVPAVRVFAVSDSNDASAADQITGTVVARVDSTLSFREGGRIVARPVDNGSRVAAGDLIARIDPDDLTEGLNAARAQSAAAARSVDAAQATAARTLADQRRMDGLAEAGAISRSAYDAAVEASRTAQARLAAARADATAANASAAVQRNRRGYAELRAPTAGVVTALLAEPGQVVAPGTPVVRLAQAGPREVIIDIPEQRRASAPRTATGSLYGGGSFSLILRELGAAADPATRTYAARYRIVGATPPLGATVTLRFPPDNGGAATSVPIGAVTERGGGPGVWIVGRNAKVGWRGVGLLGTDGERATVRGLRAGDRIVALGAQLLQPGQRVRMSSDTVMAAR